MSTRRSRARFASKPTLKHMCAPTLITHVRSLLSEDPLMQPLAACAEYTLPRQSDYRRRRLQCAALTYSNLICYSTVHRLVGISRCSLVSLEESPCWLKAGVAQSSAGCKLHRSFGWVDFRLQCCAARVRLSGGDLRPPQVSIYPPCCSDAANP